MLSITIPTKNRPSFLLQKLQYYSNVRFSGHILIGDSSDEEIALSTEKSIDEFSRQLNVVYCKYPELGEAQTTQKLLELISTPYAVWSGDDDFLVPQGLDECVRFLEANQEYNAVHGKGLSLQITNGHTVTSSQGYFQPIINGKTGFERLLQYNTESGGDVHYSVHRTESRREMYKYVHKMDCHILTAAEMPCLMSVIQGSIKQLNCLTLVRGLHDLRYETPDYLEEMMSPEWCNSLHILHHALVENLVKIDNISIDQASGIVKNVYKKRFLRVVKKQMFKNKKTNILKNKFIKATKEFINQTQITREICYFYRSIINRKNEEHLSRLLMKKSPYYPYVMPIYKVIKNPTDSECYHI